MATEDTYEHRGVLLLRVFKIMIYSLRSSSYLNMIVIETGNDVHIRPVIFRI